MTVAKVNDEILTFKAVLQIFNILQLSKTVHNRHRTPPLQASQSVINKLLRHHVPYSFTGDYFAIMYSKTWSESGLFD